MSGSIDGGGVLLEEEALLVVDMQVLYQQSRFIYIIQQPSYTPSTHAKPFNLQSVPPENSSARSAGLL